MTCTQHVYLPLGDVLGWYVYDKFDPCILVGHLLVRMFHQNPSTHTHMQNASN
jgi:hypothetical protein